MHPAGIGTMVMDAGYHSEDNLTADGPDRLIATGKRRDLERAAREAQTAPTIHPEHNEPEHASPDGAAQADAAERNAQRLRTPDGMATYRLRGHIAETPHGHIKHNMGIRKLTRRGLPRATAEWKLICATFNLSRLLCLLARTGASLPAA